MTKTTKPMPDKATRRTTYFVQGLENGGNTYNVAYTKVDGDLKCEFLDRKRAIKLLEEERKCTPDTKFRLIKRTEMFDFGEY